MPVCPPASSKRRNDAAVSQFFAASPSENFVPPPDDGHSCGLDCAFAQTIRSDPFAEEWLWCAHPARATRVVHPGRPCPRYAPADSIVPSS